MSAITPMTAAEWDTHRRIGGTAVSPNWDKRIAAALEEGEANAENARLGALLVSIREHPMSQVNATALLRLGDIPSQRFRWFTLSEPDLAEALAHLDALLPEQPAYASARDGIAAEYAGLMEARLHEATLRKLQAEADIAELRLKLMKGLPG